VTAGGAHAAITMISRVFALFGIATMTVPVVDRAAETYCWW
jgi:hypothetical protein